MMYVPLSISFPMETCDTAAFQWKLKTRPDLDLREPIPRSAFDTLSSVIQTFSPSSIPYEAFDAISMLSAPIDAIARL